MSQLEIDRSARIIRGRVAPWSTPALVNRRWVAFEPDCMTWPDVVALNLVHDRSLIIGRVADFESLDDGLYATFEIWRIRHGDRAFAVADAGWGLSGSYWPIETEYRDNTEWWISGSVSEVSLVPNPAFS